MKQHDAARRDLLRLTGLGLAAGAVTVPGTVFARAQGAGATAPAMFDVRTFGALGTGKALDTAAINKAIEACAAAGGGMVYFPAGQYLTFSIRLKSFVNLHLAQGAVIVAAGSPKPGETTGEMGGTYDAAEPNVSSTYGALDSYQDYGHNHWHNSLIWGEDLHDVSITGPGRIYGRGLSFGANRPARGEFQSLVAEQAGVAE